MYTPGGVGGVGLQIDSAFGAERISLRPLDVGSRGAYRIFGLSGSIAATLAAAAPLFSFRWGDATRIAILHELQVGIVVNGTITTAVAIALEAVRASGFSAADSGGTALTPAKAKSSMPTSLVAPSSAGDLRIASTAALTTGTRTLDTNGFGGAVCGSGTTAGATSPLAMNSIYRLLAGAEWPQLFAQNEGFVVRSVNTGPATGTFQLAVAISWSEVTNFDNALIA